MKIYALISLVVLPVCSAFYGFKGSPIQMINKTKWSKIAKGEDPFIWMINFYCVNPKTRCAKSHELREDYTEAVKILKGFVEPAAYRIVTDFPSFVRIPFVALYLPNSTEPYIFEMENHAEQVKRAGFRLVQSVQDLIINHIHSDQVRHISSSWQLKQIRRDAMMKIVANEVVNQCTFVLLYDNFTHVTEKIQLLASVATAVSKVHNLDERKIDFGIANIKEVKDAFVYWTRPVVVPKFLFFGPRNAPAGKKSCVVYNDRMDVADITRWVISRYYDMAILPDKVVQVNVRREAGFVGQVISIQDEKFFIGTH